MTCTTAHESVQRRATFIGACSCGRDSIGPCPAWRTGTRSAGCRRGLAGAGRRGSWAWLDHFWSSRVWRKSVDTHLWLCPEAHPGESRGPAPNDPERDRLPDDVLIQVAPFRVVRLDQRQLPSPSPLLDGLLPLERGSHGRVYLVPYQRMHAVALGEPSDEVLLVLPDAPSEVRGDADVERAVAPAGKDVDARD